MLKWKIWIRHHNAGRCKKNNAVVMMLLLLSILLGACTSHLPPPGFPLTSGEHRDLKDIPSETDIMHEGLKYLGSLDQQHDYVKARAAFEHLTKSYPESKWKNLAKSLITLIDKFDELQRQHKKIDDDRIRLLQENEKLRKDIKNLHERLNAETVRLSQENDQLKKDIQLLKNLEVQIEKRERMFR